MNKPLLIILSSLFIFHSCWRESANGESMSVRLDNGEVVTLYENGTWEFAKDEPPALTFSSSLTGTNKESHGKALRSGVTASEQAFEQAIIMKDQGWIYQMPRPKSEGASWRNTDGRTTWFYGYWRNQITNTYSKTQPRLSKSGKYLGDGKDYRDEWRTGGRPRNPTELEWLLSKTGGPVD